MAEEISLTSWIQKRLSGPIPVMTDETSRKVLGFFEEIREVKKSGKSFGVHIAHLRDLDEHDEAEMYEAIDEVSLQQIEKVIKDLQSRIKAESDRP
jgi:hypothetical protein